MRRLTILLVGAVALAGCPDRRERTPIASDTVTSPIEIARVDSSTVARDTVRPAPSRRIPRRARSPVRTKRSEMPVTTPAAPPDTAPSVQRDTAASVQLDSSSAVQPDTVAYHEADTMTAPRAAALPLGTEIHAALDDSINSRRDSAGKVVTANVMETMRSPDGRIVLPAGSVVQLTVTRLEPAKSRSASDGKLAVRVDGVTLGGQLQEFHAEVRPIPHELRGRGVTAGEAEKVGVGAAAGAVAGRVIGGNTRGAVIGGVVGAAGGAAVAAQTASRDVVVRSGTPVVIVLTAPLVASGSR